MFLVIIFALNILVGFACSIGVNMGFNAHHHEEEATDVSVPTPVDGNNLPPPDRSNKQLYNIKGSCGKDDCCNDKVMKLSTGEKIVPPSNTLIHQEFSASFISSFYTIDVLSSGLQTPNRKYFVRNYHPPIPDIRIAIQSFQI